MDIKYSFRYFSYKMPKIRKNLIVLWETLERLLLMNKLKSDVKVYINVLLFCVNFQLSCSNTKKIAKSPKFAVLKLFLQFYMYKNTDFYFRQSINLKWSKTTEMTVNMPIAPNILYASMVTYLRTNHMYFNNIYYCILL